MSNATPQMFVFKEEAIETENESEFEDRIMPYY